MQFFNQIPSAWYPVIALWSIAWKGFGLWHAAKRNEKWWFIAILLVNSLGILEICYLALRAKVLHLPKFASKK